MECCKLGVKRVKEGEWGERNEENAARIRKKAGNKGGRGRRRGREKMVITWFFVHFKIKAEEPAREIKNWKKKRTGGSSDL